MLPVGAGICFGRLARLRRLWAATSLRPGISWRLLSRLQLRIVNISHSEAYAAHSNDGVLLELEALRIVGFLWILADDVPELLLRVGVDTLQIDFVLVIEPVSFLTLVLLRAFLVSDSEYLACLLLLLAEVHRLRVLDGIDVGVLGSDLHDDLLRPRSRPQRQAIDFYMLLVSQELRVTTRDKDLRLNHIVLGVCVVIVEETEGVLRPRRALDLEAIRSR